MDEQKTVVMLLRRIHTGEKGTFGGLMLHDKPPFAVTLEPEWLDNEPFVSCIPAATYVCHRVHSPNYGITFKVLNVPEREDILFHWGNSLKNTKGCIVVGEEFGFLGIEPGVLSSRRAFNEFLRMVKRMDEFVLTIQDCF